MITSLKALFSEFPFSILSGSLDATQISGVTVDSRKVQPGNLFVACKGGKFDGHKFIFHAIEKGAVAIVGSEHIVDLGVPYLQIENPRQGLAYLAAAFYGFPARELTVIGVTGTDGKTTTCNILHHVLKNAGIKTGLISTVNAVIDDQVLDTGLHVTTPDAPDVQRFLAQMVAAGLTHVILETTSHGWAQYRVHA
jgi:UDP-N-acetylmuramoyl-L-alanyl-D-glutamate--2,6-diaminopimelate ligase